MRRSTFFTFSIAVVLLTAGSCKKNITIDLPPPPKFHILLRDHQTGEVVKGLKAQIVQNLGASIPFVPLGEAQTADDGSIVYIPPYEKHDLSISAPGYVNALYSLSFDHKNGSQKHAQEGSQGPNVVYAELVDIKDNDGYFVADLYPLAAVNLRIHQTTPLPMGNHDFLYFSALLKGTDPTDSRNFFGFDVFPKEGFSLDGSKMLDTTIRVPAFAGYLNEVSWSIAADTVEDNTLETRMGRKLLSKGTQTLGTLSKDTLSGFYLKF